jgi:hypothetical protein
MTAQRRKSLRRDCLIAYPILIFLLMDTLGMAGGYVWIYALIAVTAIVHLSCEWQLLLRILAIAFLIFGIAGGISDYRAGVKWQKAFDSWKQDIIRGHIRPFVAP